MVLNHSDALWSCFRTTGTHVLDQPSKAAKIAEIPSILLGLSLREGGREGMKEDWTSWEVRHFFPKKWLEVYEYSLTIS